MITTNNKPNIYRHSTFNILNYKGWAGEANRTKKANGGKNLAGVFQSDAVRAKAHNGNGSQPVGVEN